MDTKYYYGYLSTLKRVVKQYCTSGMLAVEHGIVPGTNPDIRIPFTAIPAYIIDIPFSKDNDKLVLLSAANERAMHYIRYTNTGCKYKAFFLLEDTVQTPQVPYDAKLGDYVNVDELIGVSYFSHGNIALSTQTLVDYINDAIKPAFEYFKLPMYNWGTYHAYCVVEVLQDGKKLRSIDMMVIEPDWSVNDWLEYFTNLLVMIESDSETAFEPGTVLELKVRPGSIEYNTVDLAV